MVDDWNLDVLQEKRGEVFALERLQVAAVFLQHFG
jgi:hypothetical protein